MSGASDITTDGPANISDQLRYCINLGQHTANLIYALIILSTVILIILSFTYHRVRLCKKVLWGIPGLVIPVNLLSPARFRIVYAFMFGSMSAILLNLIRSGIVSINIEVLFLDIIFNTIVSPAIVILGLSLIYFPIFACVDTPFPLLGHIVGFLYSCLLVAQQMMSYVMQFTGCSNQNPGLSTEAFAAITGVGLIPNYICYMVILVWYLWHIVVDIVDIYKVIKSENEPFVEKVMHVEKKESKYHRKYVTALLRRLVLFPGLDCLTVMEYLHYANMKRKGLVELVRRTIPTVTVGRRERWMAAGRYIFSRNKAQPESLNEWFISRIDYIFYSTGLRLPVKSVGVLTVMFMLLFQLGFQAFTLTSALGIGLVNAWERFGNVLLNNSLANTPNGTMFVQTFNDEVLRLLQGFTVVLVVASVVASVTCLILTIHMIYSLKEKLRMAVQGKFYLIAPKLQSPSYLMTSSLKYAGFQIGFFVWAWLLYWFVVVVIGSALIILILFIRVIPLWTFYYLCYILFPVIWSFLVFYIQAILCKLVFIKEGGGKFISIHNRRLWNWFEYIFFFYNAIVGIVAAILRVFLSVIINLLLLFRLDTVIFMKGFEFMDSGHKSFIGFLYLEYTYNNPVVNMFVKLMTDTVSTGGGVEADEEKAAIHQEIRNKRARNRWLVAYTLLRNPSLQELTASRIGEKKAAEEGIEEPELQDIASL